MDLCNDQTLLHPFCDLRFTRFLQDLSGELRNPKHEATAGGESPKGGLACLGKGWRSTVTASPTPYNRPKIRSALRTVKASPRLDGHLHPRLDPVP